LDIVFVTGPAKIAAPVENAPSSTHKVNVFLDPARLELEDIARLIGNAA
jgi:hypothetical protein